jgi:hypothetical protein
LFVESAFVFLEVFVEHVLAAEFVPAAEVVDFHVGEDAIFLEDPVDLFLLAPDDIPIVVPGLFPLPVHEGVVDCVLEGGFELYVRAASRMAYWGFG